MQKIQYYLNQANVLDSKGLTAQANEYRKMEQEEKEREERRARWDKEEEEESEIDEPYHAECTSCVWTGPEEDTITIEGVMCCPECREPVYTAEQVKENRVLDLNEALEDEEPT